jgi:putative membrane protein
MTRTTTGLLSIGVLLFIGVMVSQGLPAIAATLGNAGWGLILVALFHLLPLLLDAIAICVLFDAGCTGGAIRDSLLARWVGESANSLMPAGQIGGPVVMARYLAQRAMRLPEAAAVVTVSTTLQTFAMIVFALTGVLVLGAQASVVSPQATRTSALIASGFLAVQVGGFYFVQRRGFFGTLMRAITRFFAKRDWAQFMSQADAIDVAVQGIYRRKRRVTLSFTSSLAGWLAGSGEVYLIALLIGAPLSWSESLLLESLGQAIRSAGFAIPGALGIQEGGYLLLAPLAGLPPSAALALSLAKRTRELLLGLPGMLYLQLAARVATRMPPLR